jgi:hypothetical protein
MVLVAKGKSAAASTSPCRRAVSQKQIREFLVGATGDDVGLKADRQADLPADLRGTCGWTAIGSLEGHARGLVQPTTW